MKESACFLINKGFIEERVAILNETGVINKGKDCLPFTATEYIKLNEWRSKIQKLHGNQNNNVIRTFMRYYQKNIISKELRYQCGLLGSV